MLYVITHWSKQVNFKKLIQGLRVLSFGSGSISCIPVSLVLEYHAKENVDKARSLRAGWFLHARFSLNL